LYAVQSLIETMWEDKKEWQSKTRKQLKRIKQDVSDMISGYGYPTVSDWMVFKRAANRLSFGWSEHDGSKHGPAAFVCIAITLVADQVSLIPKKAKYTRAPFERLEGMLATLYRHFDPDYEDGVSSMQGEAVAKEYRFLVAG